MFMSTVLGLLPCGVLISTSGIFPASHGLTYTYMQYIRSIIVATHMHTHAHTHTRTHAHTHTRTHTHTHTHTHCTLWILPTFVLEHMEKSSHYGAIVRSERSTRATALLYHCYMPCYGEECLHHCRSTTPSRVAYRIFFMGRGGTHISAASRGSGGMLPRKFFVFCVGL